MDTKKKTNQTSVRNIIISSIVWAGVLLACSFTADDSNKKIVYILISGFFVEFLRMTSSNKPQKKETKTNEHSIK